MKKFNSIEQFRNVVTHVRKNSEYHGTPIPTLTFVGTVKLHGTNAAVRFDDGKIVAQSRERELTLDHDNAGFYRYALNHEDTFRELFQYIAESTGTGHTNFTVFGEWCGGNIQSKIGLNQLEKHFVIFNVYDNLNDCYIPRDWMMDLYDSSAIVTLHTHDIYLIMEIPSYEISVDFTRPEQVIEELERMTLAVEESCPWTEYRGKSGIGEGICWVSATDINDTGLWFKVKGLKHQGKSEGKPKTLSADPVRVAAIRELIDVLLPEWRLEQGTAWLKENGHALDAKSTGQYLQWVMKDVLKEESDTIAANQYDWKELSGYLTTKARNWYFTYLNASAFND